MRWVGYDANSIHAHHIYWPNTKCSSVERDIKFVSPIITMHSLLPNYMPATVPATAQPAAASQPPSTPAPTPSTLHHLLLHYLHLLWLLSIGRRAWLNLPSACTNLYTFQSHHFCFGRLRLGKEPQVVIFLTACLV